MKKLSVIIFAVVCLSSFAVAGQPVVAIHVSELTQALEGKAAVSPTPMGPGTTGLQWWTPWWHYFVMSDSLQEALRSDGTPFVVVTDADIRSGNLLDPSGSPKYPIVISLASEAVSDDEISPLLTYVSRGGFLFVGSSAFTRKPDGSPRGDFAIANAMGVHNATSGLDNWYPASTFTKTISHRIVSHIPAGDLRWRMPLTSDDISWGISPDHPMEGNHYAWQVNATGATVIANGDQGPYLAVTAYGNGNIIYDSAMEPLIGFGGLAPSMYSYGIFRNAIQWAFESANLPLIKLSPWPYSYNSAYMVRHDFEDYQSAIASIESSAQAENAVGAKGEYYFCTGTLRVEMNNSQTVVDSLRRAVSLYGASIGPHNGGLPNPNNPNLAVSDYDYWHWGPDEAIDAQMQGYTSGAAYASASLAQSFSDIKGWLSGLNANGNLNIWVSPYFNATREPSMQLLDQLGVNTSGEQKLSPFPHWTISTETRGKKYRFLSLPTSEWFINGDVGQAIETTHTKSTIDALVDYYYGIGALVNLYSHEPSTNPEPNEYLHYTAVKPAIWPVNASTLFNWWTQRSSAQFTPTYSVLGNRLVATVAVSHAVAAETALDVAIPNWSVASGGIQVKFDGTLVDPNSYRINNQGAKIKVGNSVSAVEVSYPLTNGPVANNDVYTRNAGTSFSIAKPGILANDSSPSGSGLAAVLVSPPANGTLSLNADGSFTYAPVSGFSGMDHFTYLASDAVDQSGVATVTLIVNPAGTLFSDGFSWLSGIDPFWVTISGSWNLVGNTMLGSSTDYSYGHAYSNGTWADYSVQAQVKFPGSAYGGGIGGRVNVSNGAHYGAWIYPEGSPGGSAILRLVKFSNWQTWSGTPMAQASLPGVGTAWHILSLTFQGNRIRVFYDGTQYIDVTDTGFDSSPAYTSGAISLDLWSENVPSSMSVANVSVQVLKPAAQNDGYSTNQQSTLDIAAPGVLGNDSGTAGSGLSAILVTPAANGTVTLQANGAFTYLPQSGFTGMDSFTYQAVSGGMQSNVATVLVMVNPPGVLFTDDFSSESGFDPWWSTVSGSWTVNSGLMQGSSSTQTYGFAYANGSWTDYSVQARVKFPAGAFGGGIGGRLNPATGAHYGAWIYPEGSGGGSSVLKLVKFHDWKTWSGTPMAQVSLPGVGTAWHTLAMTFQGNTIQVSYDGVQYISVTDSAFDSLPAYTSGGIALDMWTEATSYLFNIDDVLVQALTSNPIAQNDTYAMGQGSTLSVSAPGVLANDTGGGSGATAVLVSQPANGTLSLQSNGGFTYVPAPAFVGTDTFTYREDMGGNLSNTATASIVVMSSVNSLTLNPATVTGGRTSTATITLSGPAPSGGVSVALTSSNPSVATVPASVTIPQNATSTTVSVSTIPVGISSPSTISAAYNGTNATAVLTVLPPAVSSVTLNPATVLGGTPSTGTITLNAPAPASGTIVTLSSSNPAAATLPATVTVGANATTVTFAVTTLPVVTDAHVTISATYGAGTQTAALTVLAATLSSISLTPPSVQGGSSSTGTITLAGPAPSTGAVVTLASSNTSLARVPASVTIPGNATTVNFTVNTLAVSGIASVTISASYGGSAKSAVLTVTPAILNSLSVNPASVTGGTSSTGTVTLDSAAPAGGAVVMLTSSNASVASVPVSVTIAANTTSATFSVTTVPVATNVSVTLSASYGVNTRTATLTVKAPTLSSGSLSPSSVRGGTASTGTVTLSGPAPTGGAAVTLTSSNTSVATVPASVTIPANAGSASFSVATLPVAANTTVSISALYNGTTRSANLTVLVAALTSVSLNPTSVVGSRLSTGTVTLNGPAPAAGAVITLRSSNTSVATVPATVKIPPNATNAAFTVNTLPVSANNYLTISAIYGSTTRTASLTVTPATLSSISLSPTSVRGGTSSTGTVVLNGPAPGTGTAVALSSSNPSLASVPSSVTIPSGGTTANFVVTTVNVTSTRTVTIYGNRGVRRGASLTLTP